MGSFSHQLQLPIRSSAIQMYKTANVTVHFFVWVAFPKRGGWKGDDRFGMEWDFHITEQGTGSTNASSICMKMGAKVHQYLSDELSIRKRYANPLFMTLGYRHFTLDILHIAKKKNQHKQELFEQAKNKLLLQHGDEELGFGFQKIVDIIHLSFTMLLSSFKFLNKEVLKESFQFWSPTSRFSDYLSLLISLLPQMPHHLIRQSLIEQFPILQGWMYSWPLQSPSFSECLRESGRSYAEATYWKRSQNFVQMPSKQWPS